MNIQELTDRYVMGTYRRFPLTLKKAKGSWVWDEKGKKYLDFFSGLAVCGIGHGLPGVVKAIQKQSKTLIHTSNYFYTEPQARLAEQLCKRSFASKVFFSNSGTEANECAIKLARKAGHPKGRYEIIVFENSFHGRTLGSLAATAQPKFHEGFRPLPGGFPVAKLNDLESVKRLISDKTTAIMLEPIQGEGGIYPTTSEFLKALRELCDAHGLLLIFDSVQCSMGRTGDLFSYQTFGVTPDIMTLAKGLGGGLPIGVTLASEKYESVLVPGDHGSTFGGNPVCAAAAFEILKALSPAMLTRIRKEGAELLKEVQALVKPYSFVQEVRGMGFMLGIQLNVPGAPFVKACLDKGLLINCTQNTVLRFLPPLALTKSEKQYALKVIKDVFSSKKLQETL